MSKRFATDDPTEREAGIAAAALAVQRGQLVVLPTDTVYGVGADAFSPEAVRALLAAKGRGRDMPPPVLVSATTTLDALATGVPSYARALIEELWPGPLAVSSANRTGLEAATDAEAAEAMLGGKVEVILDAGPTKGDVPSTIVDVTGDTGRVLRPGAIPLDRLNEIVSPIGATIVDEG